MTFADAKTYSGGAAGARVGRGGHGERLLLPVAGVAGLHRSDFPVCKVLSRSVLMVARRKVALVVPVRAQFEMV